VTRAVIIFRTLYDRAGDTSALDEATKLHREALDLQPLGHPDHASACAKLAGSLLLRLYQTMDEVPLDEIAMAAGASYSSHAGTTPKAGVTAPLRSMNVVHFACHGI
jgi:hypothetical protein